MKLSDKIYTCRKKTGLSQEALAEKLGVSRQAVSKWETGEAEPDTGKLKPLAGIFGVTVDWLLTEEEPAEAGASVPTAEEAASRLYGEAGEQPRGGAERGGGNRADWTEGLPRSLEKLARRYGWLAGVYVAVSGAGIAFVGFLAWFTSRSMVESFNSMAGGLGGFGGGFGETVWYDSAGNVIGTSGGMSGFAANNPVSIVGGILLAVGILIVIAGVVLAVILKNRFDGRDQ